MPSDTQKMHNAMEAAAHGHSTLGIPKKVGQDFVAADQAAGKFRRRRTRRGGKGHPGDPKTHHQRLTQAMESGDHQMARKHAFALVRSIDHHAKRSTNGAPMAKNWISGAISHPGALHKSLGVPEGQKIPAKKLAAAAHSDNATTARRARLAETLKKMHSRKS